MPAPRPSARRREALPPAVDSPESSDDTGSPRAVIRAAGAVVTRPGREVLLVHRPRYDDWSFPKGKVDPGEHVVTAAAREVAEETGLRVRLGVPLGSQRYRVAARGGARDKTVAYWSARVVGDDTVDGYARPGEIDRVAWVPRDEAHDLLTYDHDRRTLAEAYASPRRTRTLVVLRHGLARPRSRWDGPDPERPLVEEGHDQARRWVPLLQAYDVDRVVTSPSARCVQSVQPYLDARGLEPRLVPELSEELADETAVAELVRGLLEAPGRSVLCSHRPVLPLVWRALGLRPEALEKGEALVLHVKGGRIVASETQAV
ncbi:NUDIX hydrolase [Nocardioides zeae]|uniref:NUDIX hydrolase n=1 Tax=Nocardioides imazamoxiresistens TaxID=3231893 RepID=A0ABU3PZS9_9ACTN|nr:NUDIX hydrolase [Nocardioides zeae]MDT9594768.1 NUDIX hydrolase [Nocardioides zeae]